MKNQEAYLSIRLFLILYFSVQLQVVASSYISTQISFAICQQREKFIESKAIQEPHIYRPKNLDIACGWFDVKKGGEPVTYHTCSEVNPPSSDAVNEEQRKKTATISGRSATPRIAGGEHAAAHEFPSTAMIQRGPEHLQRCGATIIAPQWLLTSAHCIYGPNKLTYQITAGRISKKGEDKNQQVRKVVLVMRHPRSHIQYNYEWNIGLIKVDKPFEFNEYVQPAKLPDRKYRAKGLFTATGWGLMCDVFKNDTCRDSDTLQKVKLLYVSDGACQERLQKKNPLHRVPKTAICAGYDDGEKDTCAGDSGGPLYQIKDKVQTLVGVTSWGDGCAEPGVPGVYTETAYYIKWIEKTIEEHS